MVHHRLSLASGATTTASPSHRRRRRQAEVQSESLRKSLFGAPHLLAAALF